jgi:hypothetical protein
MPQSTNTARLPRFCGEDGLVAVALHAIETGQAAGHTRPDEWLDDILEGRITDNVKELGWRSHCGSRRCRRAGKCVRIAGPSRT